MSTQRISINEIEIPDKIMKGLSMEMLKELADQDEGTFSQFFVGLDLDNVKNVRQRCQSVEEENHKLAVSNCEMEPKFDELKSELRRKCTLVNDLREDYQRKFQELKNYQNKTSQNVVAKELKDAAKATERESEELAADFVAGKSDLSVDDFKDEFLKQRSLYWLRKVKSEKMNELLKNLPPVAAPRTNLPSPLQSLPVPGYPPDPRRTSEPAVGHSHMPDPRRLSEIYGGGPRSLPPYPAGGISGGMPMPQQPSPGPFPAAAYYNPQQQGSRPRQPPPKPAPYNQRRY